MASESTQKRSVFAIAFISLLVLVGVAVCGGVIWLLLGRGPAYQSVCRVMVSGNSADGGLPGAATSIDVQLVMVSIRSEENLNGVWQKLEPATRKQLASVQALLRDLVVTRIEGTDVVQIEFESDRQAISRDVVQTLVDELVSKFQDSVVVIAPPRGMNLLELIEI